MDPSLGHDGYFVPEDQVTSEPEEEQDNKLVRKFVVNAHFVLRVWEWELK